MNEIPDIIEASNVTCSSMEKHYEVPVFETIEDSSNQNIVNTFTTNDPNNLILRYDEAPSATYQPNLQQTPDVRKEELLLLLKSWNQEALYRISYA